MAVCSRGCSFARSAGGSIQERAGEELGSRGTGIATHDDLHEALALATEQGGEVGVAVEGRIVLARSGDVVCEVARPQVLASWDRIWQRLRSQGYKVYRQSAAPLSSSVSRTSSRILITHFNIHSKLYRSTSGHCPNGIQDPRRVPAPIDAARRATLSQAVCA